MTSLSSTDSLAYRPLAGCYDELLDAGGQMRPHWSFLASALADLGTTELLRRQDEAARLLGQDGVSYNAYADAEAGAVDADADPDADAAARATAHPQRWRLDPVPTLMSSHEWAAIESGVIERAELLGLILEDIYGKRELLAKRLLPPEVIFSHDGFRRACDGIRMPGPQQLFSYAADLARDQSGRAVVIADRTQAPSGAGYALENRTVISRVIPSLYRDSQVHRLAPFFRSLRLALKEVAPRTAEDPRIVLLTPGSLSEAAFEHAVLASTLGFPLVEGRDLTVRGQPGVDALGRSAGADRCDPPPRRRLVL